MGWHKMMDKCINLLTLCALAVSTAAVYDRKTLQESEVHGNGECKEHQFYNFTKPGCEDCKSCSGDEPYTIKPCDEYSNTICSPCEKGWVYSDLESMCMRCCGCTSKHQPQQMCLDARLPLEQSCIEEEGAPCGPESPAKGKRWYQTNYIYCILGGVPLLALLIGVIIKFAKKPRTEEERPPVEDAGVQHDDRAELLDHEVNHQRDDEERGPDQPAQVIDDPTVEHWRHEDKGKLHQLVVN